MTKQGTKQFVVDALAGRKTGHPPAGPLAVHYCAALAGVSLRDYTCNSHVLADCVLRYFDQYRPDAVWVSADTWVSAEAAGAQVAFPGEGQPLAGTGRPLVQSAGDVNRIPPPDPLSQGRWPLMIEALGRVVSALGDDAFVVACFDQYPFSLACALMGLENLLMKLHEDPPMVEALLERCCEYSVAYARAMAAAGADMLSGGDSPAGLLGPEWYRTFALPWERAVITALKSELSLPISLHICGKATPLLVDMATSGADVFELDHFVDLASAAKLIGPQTALWGNIDPVGVLSQGSVSEVRQATRSLIESMAVNGHHRFVVSSGCTLVNETPSQNLEALFAATRG